MFFLLNRRQKEPSWKQSLKVLLCWLWAYRKCRYQRCKEYSSGRACRVSLWRGCISNLYEAGTSEHGRPSFSLRNQESSSFREERMSKKNHLPQRDFLEPLRGWRVQLLGKSHLIGCCQTGWIHRRAFWIEDLGTRTKDATLLSVDPKGWEGDLFLLYRTRQQKSLLYQQWPRGRLVRGSDQGVDVGN